MNLWYIMILSSIDCIKSGLGSLIILSTSKLYNNHNYIIGQLKSFFFNPTKMCENYSIGN